jgi:hypothetical protein
MALGETYEDRQSMLDQEAVYDDDVTILGNFENAYAETLVGTVGVQGRVPTFLCDEADVDPDPTGKSLTVEGANYTVVRGQPDGTGMILLVLEASA